MFKIDESIYNIISLYEVTKNQDNIVQRIKYLLLPSIWRGKPWVRHKQQVNMSNMLMIIMLKTPLLNHLANNKTEINSINFQKIST